MKHITPKTTVAVMCVLVGLALAYEFLTLGANNNATISEMVWNASRNTTFVFAAGFLAGHFWFPKSRCVWCGRYPNTRDDGKPPARARVVPMETDE